MPGIIKKIEGRTSWSFWSGHKFWWVQIATNGEVLSTSEIYTTATKRGTDMRGRSARGRSSGIARLAAA